MLRRGGEHSAPTLGQIMKKSCPARLFEETIRNGGKWGYLGSSALIANQTIDHPNVWGLLWESHQKCGGIR